MVGIVFASYASAAVTFGLLTIFLLVRSRRQRIDRFFFVACVLSALWAATFALSTTSSSIKLLLEISRDASWVAFLLHLIDRSPTSTTQTPTKIPRIKVAVFVLYGTLLALALSGWLQLAFASQGTAQLLITGGLVGSSLLGLLLMEKLFLGAASDDRWGIKFASLGLGAIFAYDFYLFTDALLFRQLNADIWIARGLVNALVAPLLMISFLRNPRWSVRLVVSRRIAYQSVTIIGAALYLLTMAGAGYYFRYVGGSWGTILQVALGFVAAIALIAVLFSGTVRSWLRVFISKHFYQHGYDYREEWLRFTRTLSQPGPDLEQRTIRAIAELVESPGGILYMKKDSENFAAVATTNLPLPTPTEPAGSSFIRLLRDEHWIVDLVDYEKAPKQYSANVPVPSWLTNLPRAWLVVPLIIQADLIGFIVLYQSRSPVRLNWEVLDILKITGTQAAGGLAQKQASNSLAIARQFESFNRMSTFVVHDLKNLVSQLSLLVANAERHKDSAEFQEDMLATIDHSVDRMKLLLQKFSSDSSIDRPRPLVIDDVVTKAITLKSFGNRKPQLVCKTNNALVLADPARLERVLGHFIQNALEASSAKDQVTISISEADGGLQVDISDRGTGMTEQFIAERLFKPFESTKPAGMGIGVFESREYIEELGGKIRVESTPGAGTTFSVFLPLYQTTETEATLS